MNFTPITEANLISMHPLQTALLKNYTQLFLNKISLTVSKFTH